MNKRNNGIIYKATSKTSGKSYVGQTVRSLNRRKRGHWDDSKRYNTKFYNAIKKYGWEDFEWSVLLVCDLNNLDHAEAQMMRLYDTVENGYNLMYGSSGGTKKHSEETRAKMSANRKGRTPWNKGKKLSDEHKKALSVSHSGQNHQNFGKKLAKETCSKISKGVKKSWKYRAKPI